MEAIRRDIKPRDIVTRKSIENAVAVIMATGGSTNAVLHFLAIAHAAGVAGTIDDFERIRRDPGSCATSSHPASTSPWTCTGKPAASRGDEDPAEAGLLHGDCLTITGRRWPQNLADMPPAAADQHVIPQHRPAGLRAGPPGHPARQPRRRMAAVAKITGLKNPVITGPRVFDDEHRH